MKETNLYIHIGLHKTGTTSIQQFLLRNKNKLKKQNLFYMPIPENDIVPFQHRFLVSMLDEQEKLIKYFSTNRKKKHNNLISSECFVEKMNSIDSFLKIKDLFDNVYVVVFLRRQDFWLESLYRQLVCYNEKLKLNFNEWITTLTTVSYKQFNPNYFNTLNSWAKLFGHNNLIIKPYTSNSIQSFLEIFEINGKDSDKQYQINQSFSNRETIEAIRLTNGKLNVNEQKELVSKLQLSIDENGSFYTNSLREKVIECFSESNRQLLKFYNLPQNFFDNSKEIPENAIFTGISELNKVIIKEYLLKKSQHNSI